MGVRLSVFGVSAAMALSFVACGSSDNPGGAPGVEGGPPSPIPGHSGDWCNAPAPSLGTFRPLDRDLFIQTLGSSVVGWMKPLHESLLPLDEARFLETTVEAVLGTFDTACKRDRDYELLPPDDDLLDAGVQSDAREAMADLFADSVVVPTNDPTVLRLRIHQCSACEEPLGAVPSFLTARLTEAGVLALAYEFSEGRDFTKHVYVAQDTFVFEGELGPLSDWADTATDAARTGRRRYPNAKGKLSVLVSRTTTGKLSATVGISGFSFETGSTRPVRLAAAQPCVGFHAELDRATASATFAIDAGNSTLEVPGSSQCSSDDSCSAAEREGIFSYQTSDLALSVEHPEAGGGTAARFGLSSTGDSKMTAPGGLVGSFRLGDDSPKNSSLVIELAPTPQGIRASFSPAFDARAAITLSTLSDALRADLPAWLSDEIFDLTFGDDPKPSLLIPHRAACRFDPKPVYRRLVEVEAGTVHGVVGANRDESATSGQCLGQTRRPREELAFTSDWVEVLACE